MFRSVNWPQLIILFFALGCATLTLLALRTLLRVRDEISQLLIQLRKLSPGPPVVPSVDPLVEMMDHLPRSKPADVPSPIEARPTSIPRVNPAPPPQPQEMSEVEPEVDLPINQDRLAQINFPSVLSSSTKKK